MATKLHLTHIFFLPQDDIANDEWLGVRDGLFEFLGLHSTEIAPFAIGQKIYLTTASHQRRYYDAMALVFEKFGGSRFPGKAILFDWPILVHQEGVANLDSYERAILSFWS